jgi:hypothetical protein
MRATSITSSIAGVILGLAIRLVEVNRLNHALLFPLFIILAVLAVIGLPQLREMRQERSRSGEWLLCRKEDFKAFYFPAWRRMFTWFLSCVVSFFAAKALGL